MTRYFATYRLEFRLDDENVRRIAYLAGMVLDGDQSMEPWATGTGQVRSPKPGIGIDRVFPTLLEAFLDPTAERFWRIAPAIIGAVGVSGAFAAMTTEERSGQNVRLEVIFEAQVDDAGLTGITGRAVEFVASAGPTEEYVISSVSADAERHSATVLDQTDNRASSGGPDSLKRLRRYVHEEFFPALEDLVSLPFRVRVPTPAGAPARP